MLLYNLSGHLVREIDTPNFPSDRVGYNDEIDSSLGQTTPVIAQNDYDRDDCRRVSWNASFDKVAATFYFDTGDELPGTYDVRHQSVSLIGRLRDTAGFAATAQTHAAVAAFQPGTTKLWWVDRGSDAEPSYQLTDGKQVRQLPAGLSDPPTDLVFERGSNVPVVIMGGSTAFPTYVMPDGSTRVGSTDWRGLNVGLVYDVQLPKTDYDVRTEVLSPRGDKFAFTACRVTDFDCALWTAPTSGGVPQRIATLPSWAKDLDVYSWTFYAP